jgi:SAM-dependent methyltransferase
MNEHIQRLLNGYYSEKLKLHGPDYKGADWGSLQAQQVSFVQLSRLITAENSSLLDYGCGYGALYDFLREHKLENQYTGFDISEEMLSHAKQLHAGNNAQWLSSLPGSAVYDYVIACGIFSIKLDIPVPQWEEHTLQTLQKINALSKKGFAFNSLTSYSDAPFMKDHLYYPDPCFLFDYCKKHFSKYVSLIHDYPKYEFVIIVRKDVE